MNVSTIVTDSATVNMIGDIAITSHLLSYYQLGGTKVRMIVIKTVISHTYCVMKQGNKT